MEKLCKTPPGQHIYSWRGSLYKEFGHGNMPESGTLGHKFCELIID